MPEGKLLAPPSGQGLARLAEEWTDWLRKKYKASTMRDYRFWLDDFLRYLRPLQVTDSRALTRRHVEGWQDQLTMRMLSQATRSLGTTSIKRFLLWAERKGVPFGDPNLFLNVATVPVPDRYPHPLPDEDLNKLLQYFKSQPNTQIALRNRALFDALLASGAKITDMLALNRRDLSRITSVRQAGRRTIAVPPSVAFEIAEYLDKRTDDNPALWITNHPPTIRRLAPAGVLKIWERTADAIGIRRFTSHQLRDTNTLKLMEAGVQLSVIAAHRGNKEIEPLRKYVQLIAQRRQEALDAIEQVIAGRSSKTKKKNRPTSH